MTRARWSSTRRLSKPLPDPESAPPEKAADRPHRPRIEHAAQVAPSRRGGRPAERSGTPATHVDDVTKNMANPHRDADAAVVQSQCVPAAGKSTRAGRRERDLSSRLGSLYSSRFVMNQPRGM